jgi:hypothetical protein
MNRILHALLIALAMLGLMVGVAAAAPVKWAKSYGFPIRAAPRR